MVHGDTVSAPSTGRGAIALVARRRWQSGWRQHLLLAAAVSMTVGIVLAVLLGANRSAAAMDRLRSATHASDVLLGSGDAEVGDLLASVSAAPWALESGAIRELFVRPKGSDLFPDYNLLSLAQEPTVGGASLDVPIVVEGRAPDPGRVDEVAMSEALAADLGLQVGDRIVLESTSFEWVEVAYNGGDPGPPDGPEVEAELVGLARLPADFGRYEGILHLTPAYADRYEDQVRTYTFIVAATTEAVRARLEAGERVTAGGAASLDVLLSPDSRSEAVQDSLDTVAAALRLVAATAGLAGVAVLGLITSRVAREAVADRETLIAIGWTGPEVTRLATLVLVPPLVAGLAVGLLVGVVASPLASIGLAAAIDPAGDASVVDLALVAGTALGGTALLGALLAVTAARVRTSASHARTTVPPAPALQRPLAVALGMRRALFGAPDRGGRVSRSAVVAVAAAVAIAGAALVVGSSIQRLQDEPALSGHGPPSQRVIDAGEDLEVFERAMATMDADARAVDLIGLHVAFGVQGPGAVDLSALVFDARRGDPGAAVLRGRLPAQPDEVAVGPASLELMDLAVGDEIELRAPERSARFEIVGAVLFPEGDFSHDSGVAMTAEGAAFLGGVDATAIHQIAFSWGSGIDEAAADQELSAAGFNVLTTPEGLVPASVSNLGEVRGLAPLVAGLVLVLGLVTALYAVTITGRLGRREAGTLQALGLTPGATAAVAEVQGVAVAVVGVVIGLPLGIAAGRQLWSLIADRAYVVDHPVVGWGSLAWVTGVTLVGIAVLAIPLAIKEARQRPAAVLRTE